MIEVKCPNNDCEYHTTFPRSQGFANPSKHFINYIGSTEELIKIVQQRHEKNKAKSNNGIRKAASAKAKNQIKLGFISSDIVKYLDMWLKKMVLKNMPIANVECPIERECSKRTKVSAYIDCRFIQSSAAVVESFLGEGDALLTKRRRGISSITLEMILFLKTNVDL